MKPRSIIHTVYFYNGNSMRDGELARLAIALSRHPVSHSGIEVPKGDYISETQYNALTEDLQAFFFPDELEFRLL